MKKIILAVGALLTMAFTCFAATPEKYFKYDILEPQWVQAAQMPAGDYVKIIELKESELIKDGIKTVEIPAEIEGFKVLAATITWIKENEFEKLVIPENVVFLCLANGGEKGFKEIVYEGTKDLYFVDVSSSSFTSAVFI